MLYIVVAVARTETGGGMQLTECRSTGEARDKHRNENREEVKGRNRITTDRQDETGRTASNRSPN